MQDKGNDPVQLTTYLSANLEWRHAESEFRKYVDVRVVKYVISSILIWKPGDEVVHARNLPQKASPSLLN